MNAEILAANRDWDGVVSLVDPEPVDTGITLWLALYEGQGELIWTSTLQATTRAPGPLPGHRIHDGARDFGVALGDALRRSFVSLTTSPEVRAAFLED